MITIDRRTRNGVEDTTCRLNYGVALLNAEEALLDICYMLNFELCEGISILTVFSLIY